MRIPRKWLNSAANRILKGKLDGISGHKTNGLSSRPSGTELGSSKATPLEGRRSPTWPRDGLPFERISLFRIEYVYIYRS